MHDLSPNADAVEQLDLCTLPVDQDVLSHLLDASDISAVFPRVAVDLLASDPVLCACAASVASAAAFRSGGPVPSTLESVIRRLGTRGLTALTAKIAIRQQFSAAPTGDPGVIYELRSQGELRGRIALGLAINCEYGRPDEARFAALLLDLGRIVLLAWGGASLVPGKDGGQAEIGARLLDGWGYGSLLADALRYQSEQAHQLADAHLLVKIAHAARRLAEAAPSQLEAVCQDVAVLLDSDAGDIHSLTEAESDKVRGPGPFWQPEEPKSGEGAIQHPLAGPVAGRALMGEMRAYWSAAETEKEVLCAIAQVLALFFGVRRTLYLENDGAFLRGADPFGAWPEVNEISIRLRPGAGLIARAVADTALLHTLDRDPSALTVVDRQAMGFLACGGMLCVPLAAGGEQPGVFLVGLHPSRHEWVENHRALLRSFAAEAGQALAAVRRREAHANWRRQETRMECNLRARRAVHEVRTPLGVIGNYVSVIQTKLTQGQRVETDLKVIASELARSARILREFSGGVWEQVETRELELNAMVAELAALWGETLIKGRGIKLTLGLDERVPTTLSLDAQSVRQVLTNLARNAIESMLSGGELQLSTEDRFRFEDGDYVAVSVSDTGPGLPVEVLADLFEPVRSTKGGEHQGLGLSIVKDLADRMRARIICRSREGVGTTFTVLLPRKLVPVNS